MKIDWLNRPFPFLEKSSHKLMISLGAGLVVFLFLLIFQPFGINLQLNDVVIYLFGFGVITSIVLLLSYFILPKLFHNFFYADKWTIGKNILFILWILLLITLLNYWLGQYIGSKVYEGAAARYSDEHNGLLAWFFMTFTVGVFPVAIIVYLTERVLTRRNRRIADELSKSMGEVDKKEVDYDITIESGKKKSFNLTANSFICAQAVGGNYLSLFWISDNHLKKEMVRMTLQEILEVFRDSDQIVRCHKSYVVNLSNINNFEGNARSLVLQMNGLDFDIPVSRSFPREQLLMSS